VRFFGGVAFFLGASTTFFTGAAGTAVFLAGAYLTTAAGFFFSTAAAGVDFLVLELAAGDWVWASLSSPPSFSESSLATFLVTLATYFSSAFFLPLTSAAATGAFFLGSSLAAGTAVFLTGAATALVAGFATISFKINSKFKRSGGLRGLLNNR
jgi:hypothetical protein